jgi:hypothetical protein
VRTTDRFKQARQAGHPRLVQAVGAVTCPDAGG